MTDKKRTRMSRGARGIAGLGVLVTIGVLSLVLSADIIAASIVEGTLRHKGFTCPEGIDADLSILDRKVTLEPLVCNAAEGPIESFELLAPMTILIGGAKVQQAAIDTDALKVSFRQRGDKKGDTEGFKNSDVAGLDIQEALRAMLLDLSEASKKGWPDMHIDQLTLTHKSPAVTATLDDVRLKGPQGTLSLDIGKASVKEGRKKVPVAIEAVKTEITEDSADFTGTLQISKGFGPAIFKIPVLLKITAEGFQTKNPKWTFDAAPQLPTIE